MTGTAVIQSVMRKKRLTVYGEPLGMTQKQIALLRQRWVFLIAEIWGILLERDFYYKYVLVPQRIGGCRHYLRFLLATGAFLTLFSYVLTENKHLNWLFFSGTEEKAHTEVTELGFTYTGLLSTLTLTQFPPRLEDPLLAVGGHAHGAQEENFLTFPSHFPSSPHRWRKGG